MRTIRRTRKPETGTRLLVLLALLTLAAGLSACQTFGVQTDWDPEADFSSLHRFHWVEPPEVQGANPFADNTLLRKRVRVAVKSVMEERGFLSVQTPAEADFLITYSVQLDERLRVDGFSTATEGGLYRRRGSFASGYSTSSSVHAYQESTLILDLLEPENEGLLWRGWGQGLVRTRDRDRGQDHMEAGVRAILDEFPPDAGS